jgi:hypothetical protein
MRCGGRSCLAPAQVFLAPVDRPQAAIDVA